jgi:hypothetical protein
MRERKKSNQNFIAPFVSVFLEDEDDYARLEAITNAMIYFHSPFLYPLSTIGLINGFAFCAHRFVTIQ